MPRYWDLWNVVLQYVYACCCFERSLDTFETSPLVIQVAVVSLYKACVGVQPIVDGSWCEWRMSPAPYTYSADAVP